ncbi:SGNH/GDSL hydrolase family protein [Xylophilus sp. GOD-11R]|uniref:SGNH/GDSL hydrolase family protein n=1 Tax=Xylophilus sp. GOD-11R TaxID=3089814 RepID=UPI00298C6C8B|nr:SGNH/GDSL hydrolase family protein [Xylophilus sp. GOD-11R]WPB59143.1 SGNH/GDSL hydrolase family protein [Xylophilus sp. GOD-11R]
MFLDQTKSWASVAGTLLLAAALAGCGSGGDSPLIPVQNTFVAMGDSFSSGHGTEAYPDMSQCSRTRYSYPNLWALRHGQQGFTFVACQGATTDNVLRTAQTEQGEIRPQIEAVTAATQIVTITIGGNDTGFSGIADACAISEIFDRDKASCLRKIENVLDMVQGYQLLPDNTTFYQHLLRTYQAIRGRASPTAAIFVLGYPQLYYLPTDLEAIGPNTRRKVNELMVEMNAVIRRAAEDAGVTFVTADVRFAGHGAAWDNPNGAWINNITLEDSHSSLHPNIDGHALGYLASLEDVTGR